MAVAKPKKGPLTASQQEVASSPELIRFVQAVARKYCERAGLYAGSQDPYISAAYYALCKAARDWKLGFGCTFKSYLYMRVLGELRDTGRMELPKGYRKTDLELPNVLESGFSAIPSGPDMSDELFRSEDLPVGWEIESEDAVRTLLKRVPTDHHMRRVLEGVWLRGLMQKELADELGVTQSRVSQIYNAGMVYLTSKPAPQSQSKTRAAYAERLSRSETRSRLRPLLAEQQQKLALLRQQLAEIMSWRKPTNAQINPVARAIREARAKIRELKTQLKALRSEKVTAQ